MKYFSIIIFLDDCVCDLNLGILSCKPTLYLLDYDYLILLCAKFCSIIWKWYYLVLDIRLFDVFFLFFLRLKKNFFFWFLEHCWKTWNKFYIHRSNKYFWNHFLTGTIHNIDNTVRSQVRQQEVLPGRWWFWSNFLLL